jgi:AraC-like DNA-binding protein
MLQINLPHALETFPQLNGGPVRFVSYQQPSPSANNRVVFHCYALSFVISGEKELYRGAERAVTGAGEAVFIPQGHSLITERKPRQASYSSLVVLFTPGELHEFAARHPASTKDLYPASIFSFKPGAYLQEYAASMLQLIRRGIHPPPSIIRHRLDELFLYLLEHHHHQFAPFLYNVPSDGEAELKNIVEANLLHLWNLEEFAFLAHRSLSSFKRDFEKLYGVSPGRYIRERRLELASTQLLKGKQASEIYLDHGYESLSSFIQAFKKQFGVTPGEFADTIAVP